VAGNKYRKYKIGQYFDFNMIKLLKETGSSLTEIKEYIAKKEPSKILSLFREKRDVLKQEKLQLVNRMRSVDDLIFLTRELINTRYDVFEIVEMEEEALELIRIEPINSDGIEGCISISVKFARHFESKNRIYSTPFGLLATKTDALARKYITNFCFCGATRQTKKFDLHIRPKGKYAVISHLGDNESHKRTYIDLINKIESSGLTIVGDVYLYNLIIYMIPDRKESEYAKRYCIPIR
jgi:effector-binding domain-containing protein